MFDDITAQRFWSKVDKRGDDECWPWLAGGDKQGRGHFWANGRSWVSPQVSLILSGKPFDPTLPFACHSCDNPPCVNPAHLWWGTNSQNLKDASNKGRIGFKGMTHCGRGHALTPENIEKKWNGNNCRACGRASRTRYRMKIAAQKKALRETTILNEREG